MSCKRPPLPQTEWSCLASVEDTLVPVVEIHRWKQYDKAASLVSSAGFVMHSWTLG